MSRDKDVDSKVTTTAPNHASSVEAVGFVAGDCESKKRVERKERGEGETKGKRNLSGMEGQLGNVVAISFLGKSPNSCSVNAASLLGQKPNKRRGSASLCPHICVLVFTGRLGGGRDWGVKQFLRFF